MEDPRSGHRCHCLDSRRRLLITIAEFEEARADFEALSRRLEWTVHPDHRAIELWIGPTRRFANLETLADFLSCVVGDPQTVWGVFLDPAARLEEQLDRLNESRPIADLEQSSSRLHEILEAERLESWFQPIVCAGSHALWGYECLVRGRNSAGDLIRPDQLLSWARDEGAEFKFDRICRETHLRNAGGLDRGPDCHFTINFLPSAIYEPRFCLRTSMRACRESGLDPSQVTFEVVETDKIEDPARLRTILDEYRRLGFSVALDDVAAGYAGLSLLADLAPEMIKIDRGLVSRCVDSVRHRDICETLVDLGRRVGGLVLAEGVETREQVDAMESIGVDLLQGFYFGKPSREAIEPGAGGD